MRISELISVLSAIELEHGDLQVYLSSKSESGWTPFYNVDIKPYVSNFGVKYLGIV